MPEPLVHELPMRWADLDSLNHVNNVVYLDYAAEARACLVDEGVVDAAEPIAEVTVDFLRPLLLSSRPVEVASTRDGDLLVQEVRSQGDETVFARVTTTFGPLSPLKPEAGTVAPLPVRVRRSDLDLSGQVSSTRMFELFQEARILLFSREMGGITPGRFVVGRVEVALGSPVPWRLEPYDVRTWMSRTGTSSLTLDAQLVDGDEVLAQSRSVMVGFDLETQRSRPLTEVERTKLGALTPPDQSD